MSINYPATGLGTLYPYAAPQRVTAKVYALDYWQPSDGIDGGQTINRALLAGAARYPNGFVLELGPVVWEIGTTIVVPADNIRIHGHGYGTILRPMPGFNGDVISTPIPAAQGASGYVRNYLKFQDFAIDCSAMSGTVAGQGNAIHSYGMRYSRIKDVYILSCPNWAVLLDGDNTGSQNFGYDNYVEDCILDLCNGGMYQTNCEANQFRSNQFKWAGAALAAAQPAFGAQDTTSYHLRLGSGYAYVAGNVFGKGGAYTTPAIITFNNGPCRIIGNRFDQVRNQAVTLNAGNHEFIGNQLGSPGSAITGVPGIQLGSSKNRVIGNQFDTTAGGANFTYAVAESGGPFTDNIIADNELLAGTAGLISTNAASTPKIHHNGGYNPVGPGVTQPAVPASGTALTNFSGVDCMVYIATLGGLTAVAVGGVALPGAPAVGSAYRVPAGQTITLTWATTAPTWSWFGD